ncbi:MAG: hypothetical protein AAGU21_18800 [Solidesulfovibrio sp.]|uniref:hypothetical protein n=1 Tax=Solidesulfovibrio sp. TaxID=2910990 RepID=UPI00315992D7
MSVKTLVRKAAFKAMGCVEIPFGGKVGLTPEQERAAAVRVGLRPLWLTNDPRHSHLYVMHFNGDRDATPEEAADWLQIDLERMERAGLTLAEPGDPDGFLAKWKGRARERERIKSEKEAREVVQA